MRASLIVTLLLGMALAGCLNADPTGGSADGPAKKRIIGAEAPKWDLEDLNASLSQPIFPQGAIIAEDHWTESFDGTMLHSRVYRPADRGEWLSPIILHVSPYFGANNAEANQPSGNGMDGWLVSHFIQRGYAVVLNDVRGTGESGGCLEQTGPKQTQDEYIVIEDLATQPWANGKVGMIGISYDGETQQSAAVAAPPHLTTVIPLASVAGQYEWNFYDGVPYTINGAAGMVSYATIGVEPNTPTTFLTGGDPDAPPPTMYTERFGCHPENIKEGADPRGDFNQFWKDREIRLHVDKIQNTSFLHVHGLEDWNVKPNHIRDWYELIPTPKHAWYGQWQHNFPDGNSFNPDWSRSDWRLTVHRWFDYWLLDRPTGIMDEPAVQVMDSLGRWRFEDMWPPLHAESVRLYPDASASLFDVPVRDGSVSYTDNGLPMETRGESVSFMTEPLESDLHYAGSPFFHFTATLTGAPVVQGTHFALHLVDVAPDGSERMINRGYLSAQHRDGLETSKPVPLGQAIEYHLRLFPQDDVIQAGHHIKIQLGAVDNAIQPEGNNAQVTIQLGGEKTYLELPAIDDAQARFFTPIVIEQ